MHQRLVDIRGLVELRGQVDGFDRLAKAGREAIHRLASGRIGATPEGPTHIGQARPRRPVRHRAEERRARVAAHLVGGIAATQRFGEKCHAGKIARHHARLVEDEALPEHAGARQQADARLVAHHAAKGGRADDRGIGLGAEGERHHAGRDRRGGAGRRATRRATGIMGIARRTGRVDGELGSHSLAHDHRARVPQAGDQGGIPRWPAPAVNDGAVLGRHVTRIEYVLDADRQPEERAGWLSSLLVRIERGSRRPDLFRIDVCPGLYLRLARCDDVETSFGDGRCGYPSLPQGGCQTGRRQAQEMHRLIVLALVHPVGHGSHFSGGRRPPSRRPSHYVA